MPDWLRSIRPYLVAVVVVAVAAAVRAILPLAPGAVPFITFFPAVALAALYGGVWPGVFATLLSYLVADWFFMLPPGRFNLLQGDAQSVTECLVYLTMAGLIVVLAQSLRSANAQVIRESNVAKERGDLLRITLASIGDGVIATDRECRVIFMNDVAATLTGWRDSEARGRPLTEVFNIVNERTRQTVENPCGKVMQTGMVVGLANHTVLISRDGSERPIDDSAAPILDIAGNVEGVVLVFRDATQSRQATSALQTLAAIVEHSEDAVISKNRDGVITSWNAAAERLYGYSAEEAIAQHISMIVPPDRQAELSRLMERLWRGERIEHLDTVRRRKDGSRVDVSLRISPIKDAYGDVIGASKVARDITERKQAESALAFLAQTSASLAALVDRQSALQQAAETMTPFFADYCVVYEADSDGKLVNAACAHRDPEKGRQLSERLKTYSIDAVSNSVTVRAWRTGQTQFVPEVQDKHFDDLTRTETERSLLEAIRPRSVISVPLRIRERLVGVISFVRSENSRLYSDSDVALAEELALRVATAIDNAQLLASVKEADRQKDEFLAMLAHELRNPLAAIRYSVDAARMQRADAAGELLDVIDRQVHNLARLIDDLLDISRISRDKIQLQREAMDAAVVVRRAVGTARPLIEEKRHQLALDLPTHKLPVFVDPVRAEQIFANLLTNAAKYTPEGGQISVRAFAVGEEAIIKIADTGIGIAADALPFVFELFAQADRTIDRSQGGLGIGLTVARKLAEMHGGTVTAYSEGVGKGAEFTVRLPLSEAAGKDDAMRGAGPSAAGAKLRLLVVDDNRDMAQAEALLLQKHGHEVAVAHDGEAAIQVAKEFQPHAILLDIGLPVLNGYDVAAQLRRDGFARHPLIAVSGYGQADDRERSRKAGFDYHLVKPVDVQSLMAILAQVRPDELTPDAT
jgi:PAS domain S-box-containing protein